MQKRQSSATDTTVPGNPKWPGRLDGLGAPEAVDVIVIVLVQLGLVALGPEQVTPVGSAVVHDRVTMPAKVPFG